MKDAELHRLLTRAANGDFDAIKRLSDLVQYGECMEKAFFEIASKPVYREGFVSIKNDAPSLSGFRLEKPDTAPLRVWRRKLRLVKK